MPLANAGLKLPTDTASADSVTSGAAPLLIAIAYVVVAQVFGVLPVTTIVTLIVDPDMVRVVAEPDVAEVPLTVMSTSDGLDAVGVNVNDVVQYGTVLSV